MTMRRGWWGFARSAREGLTLRLVLAEGSHVLCCTWRRTSCRCHAATAAAVAAAAASAHATAACEPAGDPVEN